MPLPSFLQRFRRQADQRADVAPPSSQDVEAMRIRARRRLIGMAVLVGAGVIGFPWLFETQPRPMSGEVQVVQAGSEAGGDLQIAGAPPGRATRTASGRVAVSGIVAPAPQGDQEIIEQGGDEAPASPRSAAEREDKPSPAPAVEKKPDGVKSADRSADKSPDKSPDKASDKASDKTSDKASNKATEKHADKNTDKPLKPAKDAAKDTPKDAPKDNGKSGAKDASKEPVKAADKPADKDKAATRYVVQFGAFADANTAHEARMKVERLGLKTYTQQVDTPAGKRIRVRMGPYADKSEADKAMATLRKAGLSGAVLTL